MGDIAEKGTAAEVMKISEEVRNVWSRRGFESQTKGLGLSLSLFVALTKYLRKITLGRKDLFWFTEL